MQVLKKIKELTDSSDTATGRLYYNISEFREVIMLLVPDVGIDIEGTSSRSIHDTVIYTLGASGYTEQ